MSAQNSIERKFYLDKDVTAKLDAEVALRGWQEGDELDVRGVIAGQAMKRFLNAVRSDLGRKATPDELISECLRRYLA